MNCYFLLLLLKLNNAVGANGSGKSNVLYGEIEPLEFLVSDAVSHNLCGFGCCCCSKAQGLETQTEAKEKPKEK
ncbi:unnamed protein product [Arabidopsis thaliana]|uniref:(thale cress) hypothetical protein n=1 Tax=Arabidopsis thaliana TaxID=3702 RepID=A0A7G2DY90_ARATH|nr:unnamed protein product [Arabidopsis thaliana]